jgi:hypothetical protein
MTDPNAPTTAYPQPGALPATGAPDRSAYDAADPTGPRSDRDPARPGQLKPEEPRRHPVAYLALALSAVALLWLAVDAAAGSGDGYQKVRVGTQDCVSVPQDSGPAALYCRTSGAVATK